MRFKTSLLASLASSYLRFVGLTSRITFIHRSVREDLERQRRGFIYAFWHGRQVFLAYLHAHDRIRPLVSHSKDGELIAGVCKAFGLETVRGSSSQGGAEAVLELKSLVEKGERIGFTPDGPRGPLRSVQPGVLYLAQKTGAPIVPVAYGAKRRWIFKKSWDEFVVPQPFNHIAMVYGDPLNVLPADNLSDKARVLKAALDDVTREADRFVGAESC